MDCSLCGSTNTDDAVACATCGAALSPVESSSGDALPAGTTLQNGAFRIDAVLGQGGFGITYRGFDLQLHRSVAIKEFFPFGCRRFSNLDVQPSQSLSLSSYGAFKSRFVEEARVLARFKHPAIVDVYSVWEENNAAYMVMELLEGQTLEQVLHERNQPLEESEVLSLAGRIGDALSEVHSRGLLHRDIKPANIVQCDDGRVMLIDFGTAREYSKDAQTLQGHSIIVTPGYAPLEQYAERATRGAYTDVYSLAATLYHLLTGEMPPAASDRALGVELRPAHELNPKVSPTVSAALGCAMETPVARRPQSVDEFLKMLHGQRAAALAPQSSTRLAGATGEALDFPRETSNKNLNVVKEYERLSAVAREEWEALHRIGVDTGVDKDYERPSALEARKQLLKNLPMASSIETSQRAALAALATSRPASNPALQRAMAEQKSLFPPADDSLLQANEDSSLWSHPGVVFGVFLVLIWLFVSFVLQLRDNSNRFTPPNYNFQPTTVPATRPMTDISEFLRGQNLEVQQPVAAKTFPGVRSLKYGFCQFSADGKRVAVQDGMTYQIHIYEVPSLRPVSVLPQIEGGLGWKFSADGSLLLVQTAKNIQLWDVKGAKQKFLWRVESEGAPYSRPFDISPNGKLVIGMQNSSTVAVWSAELGKPLYKKQVPALYSPLVFTQDSKQWVSFFPDAPGQKQMQRYEAQTGKKIAAQDFPISEDLSDPQFLPDNRFVARITRPSRTGGVTLSAVVDFQSSDVVIQQITYIAPSSWLGNDSHGSPISDSWPVAWSSGARFVLGFHSFRGNSFGLISFIRKFDPKTTKPLGVAVLSTGHYKPYPIESTMPPLGGMFSPDNKFLYVVRVDGKLFTWRVDQLKWSK